MNSSCTLPICTKQVQFRKSHFLAVPYKIGTAKEADFITVGWLMLLPEWIFFYYPKQQVSFVLLFLNRGASTCALFPCTFFSNKDALLKRFNHKYRSEVGRGMFFVWSNISWDSMSFSVQLITLKRESRKITKQFLQKHTLENNEWWRVECENIWRMIDGRDDPVSSPKQWWSRWNPSRSGKNSQSLHTAYQKLLLKLANKAGISIDDDS